MDKNLGRSKVDFTYWQVDGLSMEERRRVILNANKMARPLIVYGIQAADQTMSSDPYFMWKNRARSILCAKYGVYEFEILFTAGWNGSVHGTFFIKKHNRIQDLQKLGGLSQ